MSRRGESSSFFRATVPAIFAGLLPYETRNRPLLYSLETQKDHVGKTANKCAPIFFMHFLKHFR